MNEFSRQAHPDAAHRERLSREIPGLSPRQVQVWFQNRYHRNLWHGCEMVLTCPLQTSQAKTPHESRQRQSVEVSNVTGEFRSNADAASAL